MWRFNRLRQATGVMPPAVTAPAGCYERGGRHGIEIGLLIAIGCKLGGFVALFSHRIVIQQPWKVVIDGRMSNGGLVMANR